MFESCELAFDGREAVQYVERMKPDLLITSVVLPGIDGIGAISEARRSCKDIAIVVSSAVQSGYVIDLAFKKGADMYITKPVEYDVFSERLRALLNDRPSYTGTVIRQDNGQKRIMAIITREIQRIGISAGIKGFRYVRYAIWLTLGEDRKKSMMGYIYPAVAQQFGTTWQCVERDIRHAIESAWIHGSISYIDEVFGFTVYADKGKPTNAAFIATVAEKIRLELP